MGIEHLQNSVGIAVAVVWRIIFQIGFQCFKIGFHFHHPQNPLGDVSLDIPELQLSDVPN
jgi:hypothetical protein